MATTSVRYYTNKTHYRSLSVSDLIGETIDSGKIKLDLVLANMPLDTEVDLCLTLPSVGLQCPLYKGYNQMWNIKQKIPNDAPTVRHTAESTSIMLYYLYRVNIKALSLYRSLMVLN